MNRIFAYCDFSFRRFVVGCFWPISVALILVMSGASSQTAAADAREMENRFLFIIDTSSAMTAEAQASRDAVLQLLKSNVQGQMWTGDTFGIWTYNDKLHTEFPMQTWAEDSRDTILQTVTQFLTALRYEKKAHLEKVLPSMLAVMRGSRTLTIVLVSDGSGLMQGTPFDSDINDLHKEYGPDLHAANSPFLTVLAARNGQFFDYTVNSSISTIRIPQTAEPLNKIERPKTNSVAAVTNAPAPAAVLKPPTREITLVHPPKTNAVAPVAPAEAPKPAASTASTGGEVPVSNAVPSVVASNTEKINAPEVAPVAKPAPAPSIVETKVAPAPVATNAPVPAPVVVPAPPVVKTEVQKPEDPKPQPTPAASTPVAPPAAPVPTPAPVAVHSETKPVVTAPVAPVVPQPSLTQPPVAPAPTRQELEQTRTESAPATRVAPAAAPAKAPAIAHEVAAATPTLNTGAWILLSIAVLLLTIAVALLVFILCRSRPNESSIISQSMDRVK